MASPLLSPLLRAAAALAALQIASGALESALTGENTGAGSGCSDVGQNCNITGCCNDKGHTCFEKNPEWAMCMPDYSCMEGNHSDDAEEFRTPWSCKVLQKQCSGIFQQCGGKGWSGPICCADGCMCNKTGGEDGYFWQCMPPSIHMSSCPGAATQTEIVAADASAAEEAMADLGHGRVGILAVIPLAGIAALAGSFAVVGRVMRRTRRELVPRQVGPVDPHGDVGSEDEANAAAPARDRE